MAAALVGWRLVLIQRGLVQAFPDEPEAIAPAALPQADLRERTLAHPRPGRAAQRADGTPSPTPAEAAPASTMRSTSWPRAGRRCWRWRTGPSSASIAGVREGSRCISSTAPADTATTTRTSIGTRTGLAEGKRVTRGDVLGYVGTTGNAPRSAPHLHFAIYEVADPKRPWRGRPIDPYPLWR